MKRTVVKDKENYHDLDNVLEKYKGKEGVLIKALQEAQEIYGYLSRDVLVHIAYELDVPLSEIYSVVSFYSLFKTEPSGKCHVEVCSGTACYVKGLKNILDYFEDELSLTPGEMTKDRKLSLSTVNCVGACSAAPVIKIGDELFGDITNQSLKQILEKHGHE